MRFPVLVRAPRTGLSLHLLHSGFRTKENTGKPLAVGFGQVSSTFGPCGDSDAWDNLLGLAARFPEGGVWFEDGVCRQD